MLGWRGLDRGTNAGKLVRSPHVFSRRHEIQITILLFFERVKPRYETVLSCYTISDLHVPDPENFVSQTTNTCVNKPPTRQLPLLMLTSTCGGYGEATNTIPSHHVLSHPAINTATTTSRKTSASRMLD